MEKLTSTNIHCKEQTAVMEPQVPVYSATSNLNVQMSPNSKAKPTRINLDEMTTRNPTPSPTTAKKPLLAVPPPVAGKLL